MGDPQWWSDERDGADLELQRDGDDEPLADFISPILASHEKRLQFTADVAAAKEKVRKRITAITGRPHPKPGSGRGRVVRGDNVRRLKDLKSAWAELEKGNLPRFTLQVGRRGAAAASAAADDVATLAQTAAGFAFVHTHGTGPSPGSSSAKVRASLTCNADPLR